MEEKDIKKEELSNITVIVPIYELNETVNTLLEVAIKSIFKQNVTPRLSFVLPKTLHKELEKVIKNFKDLDFKYETIINDGDTDFCNQINYGVSKIETEFFSILELDDEYSDTYFKNVKTYMEAYPNVNGFIPVTILVDSDSNALGFVNESVHASQFGEKAGFLDTNSLLQYNEYVISGGVFKKEAFEEVGGLKSNIKLFFIYEFLLRFVNNDFSVMSIPKLGYKHTMGRKNSLFDQYKDPETGITPKEAIFYLETAKKEYHFNPNEIERDIIYKAESK